VEKQAKSYTSRVVLSRAKKENVERLSLQGERMIELKISIRMESDELPLIKEIKEVAKKHGVDVKNHFIYRTKTIGVDE